MLSLEEEGNRREGSWGGEREERKEEREAKEESKGGRRGRRENGRETSGLPPR